MTEIPTGAVTFLFTDIEGSTRLVKELRETYAEVLAEHRRLLRDAFAAHGGYEVDTQGDSFFVAFASAQDAVLSAVEGQRALLTHTWPDGVEIRVRMGLHTGQAVASDGRYTGLAVHRAARIGAAGHGGQILLSQATQTLIEDEEKDLGIQLRDLGEQQLKDLDRPVRLYQVAADGLPTAFAPVRSGGERRGGRRGLVLAGVALALALAIVGGVYLQTRDARSGLAGVSPNAVGVIDPSSDTIVAEVPVGIRPGPIAAGESSLWVGNVDDQTLTRIDPATRTTAGTIPLDDRTPTGLAVGLGSVWVAHGLRGEVSRVDPQFGQIAGTTRAGGTSFGSPYGAVAVDAETVWAVFGDSTLARLDPDGNVLGRGLTGTQPAGIATAADSVWVANSGDATVQRFSMRTFEEGPLRTFNVGTQPIGVAASHGAIWVANAGADFVTRIDPASGSTLQITVGDGPTALAGDATGVWVANTAAGTVSRIDVESNEVVATIDVGNSPAGIVAAGGYVWVSVQAP